TTGQGDEHIAVAMMKLGAKDYLIKNIHFLEILPEVIKRVSKEIENEEKLKQAEEKLRLSNSRNIAMISNISDVIGIIGVDGIMKYKSSNIEKLFGWLPEELVGRDAFSNVHREDLERMQKIFTTLLEKDNSSSTMELKYKCKDGSYKPINLTATNLTNDPNINGVLLNYHDITKRKQAEEELQESESKLLNIFENSTNLFYSHNLDHVVTYLSPQVENILGYSPEEAMIKWTELASENPINEIGFNITVKAIETGKPQPSYELELVHKNGKKVFVEVREAPLVKDGETVSIVGSLTDITERKQAEERLMKSETLYRELVESMIDGVYKSTHEGRFLEVNQAMVKILGYSSKEELMAVDIKTELYFNETDRENITANELQKGTDIYQLRKKDGSAVWVEDHGGYVYSDEGNILYHEGVLRDITERKQIEEALRHNEEMILSSQSVANICSYSTNLDVNEIEKSAWVCSPEFYKIFGIDETYPHTIEGWANFIHPDYRKEVFEYHESVVKERKIFNRDYKIIRINDGAERWVHGTGKLEFDEKGNPARMHGAIQDITERKQAEEALRKSEAIKNTMVANIGDVIVIIDQNGINKYKSPNVTKLFGWKPEELVGQSTWANVHPDDLESAQKFLGTIATEPNATGTTELRYKRKDGKYVWIEINVINLLNDKDIQGVLGNYHDITERKLAEEKLLESERKLQLINKELEIFKIIADNAVYGKAIADLKGNIIYINKFFANIHGYTPEDLIGVNLSLFHNQKQMKDVGELNESLIKNGYFAPTEIWHANREGTEFPMLMSGTLIKDETGNPLYFAASAVDITERKQAEEALRHNEEMILSSQSVANICSYSTNLDVNEIEKSAWVCSPEFYKIFGIDETYPHTIEGWANFIHPDYRKEVFEYHESVVKERKIFNRDYKIIRINDGAERWVHGTGKLEFDEKGNPARMHGAIQDITERKQAEELLRAREARWSALTANFEGIVQILGTDGTIKFMSRVYPPHTMEDVVGKSAFDFMDEGSADKARQALKDVIAGAGAQAFEIAIHLPDGAAVPFEVKYVPQFKQDGSIDSIIALVTDITERKQAEDALKESEERFSRLSNLTYEGILIHKDGVVIDVNEAIVKMSGYKREELIGKNIIQMIIPPKYHEALFASMQSEVALPFEVEGIRKDGTVVPLEIESRNIDYGKDNKNVRVTAVRDITIRKKSEQEILKLSNAIEQTPVSIVITNIDGSIEYVNPKFTELTGYTLEEAYNQNPRVLKSGEQSDEFYKNLWETISSGNIWAGEFHNKKKNGELFWESAIISPVKDNEGKITHYIAVKEDITEKKKMIEDLVISKEKAVNADKMKDIFLAQMSHEIRTPINALVSMASLLRYDFEEGADDDQLMSFEVIDRAGGRIIRTVDLILNLSEIQAGTYEVSPTQFDIISDILSIIMAEYKKVAIKKKVKLSLNSNMIDTELMADSYTVNQIFTQLIDNAIKYTEEGEIIIKVDRNEAEQLVVEIKDTGLGIEESYLPQLFEPFSQEQMGYTRKFEGNGIGMALVNKYCELNNAKIEVESTKGVGSTFRVTFN
ncbi:MAG: PAS domain S-box protein, partial [Melioribacteraceae bacterium]|nr:PAS domain S-box protein [Melioribacteraceae bacterium]